jgi:O-antigen ligase
MVVNIFYYHIVNYRKIYLHRIFYYLLLLFLPSQLGFHFWPAWSYVLGRRIDYLSPTFYFTDVLLVAILYSWLVSYVARQVQKKAWITEYQKLRMLIYSPKIFFILFFCIFVCINILGSQNKPVCVYAWIKLVEYVLFGMYILQTKPKISDMVVPLSIGVLYTSVIAIIQFFLHHSVGGLLWFIGERTFTVMTPGIARFRLCSIFTGSCPLLLRPYGTFSHSNVLGGYLATMIVFFIGHIGHIGRISRVRKLSIWSSIFLGTIALVLSFSRSAWMFGSFGIGSVYLLSHKKPSVFVSIVLVTLLGLGFVYKPSIGDESVINRFALNQAAIGFWHHSPIVGIGLDNFIVRLPETNLIRQINFLQPVHNIYLLLLSETGIIGFVIFLCILYVVIRNRHKEIRPYYVSLIVLLLLGCVDHYLLTLQQGQLLLTIFFALCLLA